MGTTGFTLTYLEGALSKATYPADELMNLDPVNGRPLLARYDREKAARALMPESLVSRQTTGGMWRRWAELLPVREQGNVVSLGEGGMPLLPQPRLGETLGVPRLFTKAESLNPTGLFKARGMAAAVSRGLELGTSSFIAPYAGNAAGALAAYGAAASVEVTVLLPADVAPAGRSEVLAMDARLVLVEGLISDCGRIAVAMAGRSGPSTSVVSRSRTASKARRRWGWSWRGSVAGGCPT